MCCPSSWNHAASPYLPLAAGEAIMSIDARRPPLALGRARALCGLRRGHPRGRCLPDAAPRHLEAFRRRSSAWRRSWEHGATRQLRQRNPSAVDEVLRLFRLEVDGFLGRGSTRSADTSRRSRHPGPPPTQRRSGPSNGRGSLRPETTRRATASAAAASRPSPARPPAYTRRSRSPLAASCRPSSAP